MRNFRLGLLGTLGALLLLLSLAHGYLGWGELAIQLVEVNANPELTGSLRMGWYFGSVCFCVFGLTLVEQGFRALRHQNVNPFTIGAIGFGLLAFAGLGYALRGPSPHYVAFSVLGLLVVIAAILPSPGSTPQNDNTNA